MADQIINRWTLYRFRVTRDMQASLLYGFSTLIVKETRSRT